MPDRRRARPVGMGVLAEDDIALAPLRARYAEGPDQVLADLLRAADGAAAEDVISRFDALVTAAEVLADAGRNAEALAMSRRALAAADSLSDRVLARITVGSCLAGTGRFEEAEAVFREVLADERAGDVFPAALTCSQAARDFAAAGERSRALSWVGMALALRGGEAPLTLLEQRRGIRAALGLAADADDDRAVRLRAERDESLMSTRLRESGRPWILFWSEREYERLARQLPALAERVAPSWEEHRRQVEFRLRDQGRSGAVLCAGSVDWLPGYLDDARQGPMAAGVLDGLATYLLDLGFHTEWAPGPLRRCWCESGRRHQRCCARL